MFPCTFQDFVVFENLRILKNPKSPFDTVFLYITHSKSPFDTVFLYITYSKSPFDTVLGSLPPPRGLCACLRRFGDLRKNTSLEFWSMYLVDLINFHRFLVPPTTPWSRCLPAALRRPARSPLYLSICGWPARSPGGPAVGYVWSCICPLYLSIVCVSFPYVIGICHFYQSCRARRRRRMRILHLKSNNPTLKGGEIR